MNTNPSLQVSRSHRLQRGQSFIELAFILASLGIIAVLIMNATGASNSDVVARINCTIQGKQWVDVETTVQRIPSPLYGCLKAGVTDASFYSSSYLGSRGSYLPGMIFDTRSRRRIG